VEAVGVLDRIHGQQRLVEVELLRDRVLDQIAVDFGIGVELRRPRPAGRACSPSPGTPICWR
jgi:hypothetical protein